MIAICLAIRHQGDTVYCVLLLIASVLYWIPVILNKADFTQLSRWLACALPPISVTILSVSHKVLYPDTIRIFNYLDVRFFLIGCMVIPLLVVQMKEKALLLMTLSVSSILLILLDPIFNLLHIGYRDLVGNVGTYYFAANFYSIASYIFILSSLLFEKRLSEKALQENEVLISFLNKANKEIADQNTSIKNQAGELWAKQDQLLEANALIESQKEKLLEVQSGLQVELVERNKQLTSANDELIKYNSELQQFSYTISHNLRGPLARLLGLTNLMEKDLANLSPQHLELIKLVNESARELDEVIRDLGKIIDIRNDIFRIREKVFFQEEWSQVQRSLTSFVHPGMHFETDFRNAPMIFTVRPILTSVLYNLLSNSIKYHSPDRPLLVSVKTTRTEEGVILEVSDNGLGIDLSQNDRNVFGLYKRFHTHTEGKGLGLYLVKLQIESIGGSIEVSSELNKGTTFRVTFREPVGVEKQIIFDNDAGSIVYNGRTNCTGIAWKRNVTSEEYRSLISKSLEIVKLYHSPFWISDLRKQGSLSEVDQQWMSAIVFPEATRFGLRKVACVLANENPNDGYESLAKATLSHFGTQFAFFTEYEAAEAWLESFIEVPQA